VLVIDESAFRRVPLPLPNPERIVLITRKDPQMLAEAWDAGIVSVLSDEDPVNTVLMAIMAAALRLGKTRAAASFRGISPTAMISPAPVAPKSRPYPQKRCKTP
jgi:hypothetical protein